MRNLTLSDNAVEWLISCCEDNEEKLIRAGLCSKDNHETRLLETTSRAHWETFRCTTPHNELLTCVYSYVPDKLTGLLESLSAVLAAVCEAAAVDVLLVIPGTGRQGPAREEKHTKVIHARNVQHLSTWHSAGISLVILTCFAFFFYSFFLNTLKLSTHEIRYETLLCRCTWLVPGS